MQKTKIEWADYTWNPVTGCLHGCEYCYARGIARRFEGVELHSAYGYGADDKWHRADDPFAEPFDHAKLFVIDKSLFVERKNGELEKAPYPFGFEPTYHRYRLDEPKKVRKSQRIFVVSMGDLFGDWVPDGWIEEVFKACAEAPWHTYIFLTKNPARFQDTFLIHRLGITRNMWFGFSASDQKALNEIAMGARWLPVNSFISIEPLHGLVNLTKIEPVGVDAILDFITGAQYWFMGGDNKGKALRWVIIGAETGNRKGKIQPNREWVDSIVGQCQNNSIPVFMKDSLRKLMGDDFIQDWPWGLKQ